MQINWTILIVTGVVLLALLLFLNISNKRDRKKLTNQLNKDFDKREKLTDDEDPDDLKGS